MTKKKLKKKESTVFDIGIPLFFSGSTLTDQENFAEFNLTKVPKLNYKFAKFKFVNNIEETNIPFELGEEITDDIIFTEEWKNGSDFTINNRRIKRIYIDHFFLKYTLLRLFWIKSIAGNSVNNKIAVISDTGNLVGLVNTKPLVETAN